MRHETTTLSHVTDRCLEARCCHGTIKPARSPSASGSGLLAIAGYYFENEVFQLFRAVSFGYVDKNVDFFCANWSCFPKMK